MKQTITLKPRPYLMVNKIQPYAWGSRGKDAFIPRFLGIEVEADRPFAELWMGVHPNAPSDVILDGSPVSLRQLISRNPLEILGQEVFDKFSGTLPFLFKVLSAAQVLSIQVHPNKEQARSLHARDPEHYPDDNHKPEIAIALDSLTALVGFKRFSGVVQTLEEYPELAGFIGPDVHRELRSAQGLSYPEQRELVRLMYSTLVRRSISHGEELVESIAQLEKRLRETPDTLKEEERIFLDLRRTYTGADVGLFSIFLLNLVHLEQGQGMFIKAGIPHVYVRGNIVECMANSDNVVRAGLTPKFKDIETLVEILTYELGPVPVLEGRPDLDKVVYRTPATEFQVSRWKVEPGAGIVEATGNRPRILLVTRGEILVSWESVPGSSGETGQPFHRGQSILIPACLEEFQVTSMSPAELFTVQVPPPRPR